jgi:hypothetical protein
MNSQIRSSLPVPWHWDDTDLTTQLRRELPLDHKLVFKKVRSIGRRQDNDDVLFEIEDDHYKYAVVHLTWAQNRLKDNSYPTTEFYEDWDDVFKNRILLDKRFWEALENEK